MNRAKQAFICGVPTAISYDVVDCDGKLGVIYEKVEDTLAQRICEEPERIDEYADLYAQMLKTLHTADASMSSAVILARRMRKNERPLPGCVSPCVCCGWFCFWPRVQNT